MEIDLKITMILLCIRVGAYAATTDVIVTSTSFELPPTDQLTTVNYLQDEYNQMTDRKTVQTTSEPTETTIDSTTTNYHETTEKVINKTLNSTVDGQSNETDAVKTNVEKTLPPSLAITYITPTRHFTESVSTVSSIDDSLDSEDVFQSTEDKVLVPLVPETTRVIEFRTITPTTQRKETTEAATLTKIFIGPQNKAHTRRPRTDQQGRKEAVLIEEDWHRTQSATGEIKETANAEDPGKATDLDKDDLYYNSPQYIQRRTINHAAVWITVGFVVILLTYIMALFIHDKGRSEWRLATQNYSRFENESTQDDDNTSITIDLDEPSTPFTVTSAVIETTSSQNLIPKHPVITTRRSY